MAYVKKQKLIAIVGPTASGKSELAVKIAKKFNGEIISADSRQVYRGLDIGTGKVNGKWHTKLKTKNAKIKTTTQNSPPETDPPRAKKVFVYKGVPHYCIDYISPGRQYTVAEYKKCAEAAIRDITERGKIPVLVGGTGFWIDAVVYDLDFPRVSPNKKLREKLAKKDASELFAIIKKLDRERAETIDSKNPRRLIRAIEIAKALGRVPAIKKHYCYQVLWIGITLSKKKLRARIHRRLLNRMHQGMFAEAKKLHKNGLPWKRFYELGLEYRFCADYLRGRLAKGEMIQKLERAINDYARRQMVWFRPHASIHWVENEGALLKVSKFL